MAEKDGAECQKKETQKGATNGKVEKGTLTVLTDKKVRVGYDVVGVRSTRPVPGLLREDDHRTVSREKVKVGRVHESTHDVQRDGAI